MRKLIVALLLIAASANAQISSITVAQGSAGCVATNTCAAVVRTARVVFTSGCTLTQGPGEADLACGGGGGSVTSVGLSMPNIFTVTGSPVVGAGTLTATLNTESANTVFAGPIAGGPLTPTFRALVSGDIPSTVTNVGYFDVRTYGAVGDCVSDDGPAFQLAFDAATSQVGNGRSGTVFIPPTPNCWLIKTSVTELIPGNGTPANTFRVLGSGADGPVMIQLDNVTDAFTISAQGEWFQGIIENVAVVTHDMSQLSVDCRDVWNLTAAGPGNWIVSKLQDIGIVVARSVIHTNVGNYRIVDYHDGGGIASLSNGFIFVDQSNTVEIDNAYAFWQGQWRGVSFSLGGALALVYINPRLTADFNGNNEGTSVSIRSSSAFARTLTPVYVAGDATHITKQVVIRDSFINSGGNDILYFDNIQDFEIRTSHISCSGTGRIEAGPNVNRVKFDNVILSSIGGGKIFFAADISLVSAEIINTPLDAQTQSAAGVVPYNGFTPTTGITSLVYRTDDGVRRRIVNSGAAVPINNLVKPDGSGNYIKLADADNGKLATGVAFEATSAINVTFAVAEGRGQRVTVATDGTAITEGAPVYASALAAHGGQVSAVVFGSQIGIALGVDSGGVVVIELLGGGAAPSEWSFSAYNAANIAAATAFAQTFVTNAATITAGGTTAVTDIPGSTSGSYVTKLCSDGTTCAGGNVYVTCTFNCTAAAGTITSCTLTKSAVPAGTTLTLGVATACNTTDPGANFAVHFTSP